MYAYIQDDARQKFTRFVREKAVLLQVCTDSTPMRLSTGPLGNATSVEVYVRTIFAQVSDGEEMKFTPEISSPINSTAAGVLSTIPLSELFIQGLTSRPGF